MNELSLFSGAGGGLLGSLLLGWNHIGYVEIDDYCQQIIAQRIKDGILDNAPIFTDIKTFINTGCCELYKGITDVITAGFPCQPFSVAGKRKGKDDSRNMWPETVEVIKYVYPRFILLENVSGIKPYLPMVIRNLRRVGYSVKKPIIITATSLGYPHKRERIWLFAYPHSNMRKAECTQSKNNYQKIATEYSRGQSMRLGKIKQSYNWLNKAKRVDDGITGGVDELKAIGNMQLPDMVQAAWGLLTYDFNI